MKINMQSIVSFFTLCLTSFTLHAADAKYNFPKTFLFNDKVWKLDFQDESEHSILAEYVTNGESVKNWTQLFTYQQMRKPLPAEVTPENFAEHIDAGLKSKDITYRFSVLNASENEAMIEFRITSPRKLQQDELQRIIKKKDGIFIMIHYVIKKPDMGSAARAAWVENLKSVPMILF